MAGGDARQCHSESKLLASPKTSEPPAHRVAGAQGGNALKGWKVLAPRAGFEPATIRLTVECSTAELPRNRRTKVRERAAYNKAFRACKGPNRRLRVGSGWSLKGPRHKALLSFRAPDRPVDGTEQAQFRHPQVSWGGPPIRLNRSGGSLMPGSRELIPCQP
jgi:hypothetical protein